MQEEQVIFDKTPAFYRMLLWEIFGNDPQVIKDKLLSVSLTALSSDDFEENQPARHDLYILLSSLESVIQKAEVKN